VIELDLVMQGVPRRLVYKRFRVTAWSDPLAALVRRPPALHSWVLGHGLGERGLPTPRPLAVLHRRRRGLPGEGYLLTEKVPAAVDLLRYAADLQRRPAGERRRELREALDRLARLVRALHRRRLSHRDLKAANVLVQTSGVEGQPAGPPLSLFSLPSDSFEGLWLIDLVGVRRLGKLSKRRRVQNLARLHASFYRNSAVSRADKLRFLRTYLQWGLHGKAGWKAWWRAVARATEAKLARNRRNGRPLA
jgi:hypothetical protein